MLNKLSINTKMQRVIPSPSLNLLNRSINPMPKMEEKALPMVRAMIESIWPDPIKIESQLINTLVKGSMNQDLSVTRLEELRTPKIQQE